MISFILTDHAVENSESGEEDEFIVHSAEEAIRRIQEEGIKCNRRDGEDIFTALFSWRAADKEEGYM